MTHATIANGKTVSIGDRAWLRWPTGRVTSHRVTRIVEHEGRTLVCCGVCYEFEAPRWYATEAEAAAAGAVWAR